MDLLILAALIALLMACIVIITKLNKHSVWLKGLDSSVDLLLDLEKHKLIQKSLDHTLHEVDEHSKAMECFLAEHAQQASSEKLPKVETSDGP